MYPRRLLIPLAVASFLLGLLLLAPARLLVGALPLQAAGLTPLGVTGTLGEGAAVLQAGGERWQLRWQASPGWLLLLQVRLAVAVQGADSRLEGGLVLAPWGRQVQLDRLELGTTTLNSLLRRQRVTFDQPLAGSGLQLAWRGDAVTAADGRLAWGPGQVVRSDKGEQQSLALPALRGTLAVDGGRARLVVDSERAPGEPLATATWDPAAGTLGAVVLQRAVDLAGAGEGRPRPPETEVFSWQQALR